MKTKLLALFVAVVMALTVAGTAYATWSKTYAIGGNVTIGTFDLSISATEADSSNPYGGSSVTYMPFAPEDNMGIDGLVNINFDRAVPGAYVTADVIIQNLGTLPAKITSISSPSITQDGVSTTTGISVVYGGANPPAIGDTIAAGKNQIFTVTATVLDSAVSGSSYYFSFDIGLGLA